MKTKTVEITDRCEFAYNEAYEDKRGNAKVKNVAVVCGTADIGRRLTLPEAKAAELIKAGAAKAVKGGASDE